MSRTRKAPQTWEEQIDLVAKHGHEVDQRSVDQRAAGAAGTRTASPQIALTAVSSAPCTVGAVGWICQP